MNSTESDVCYFEVDAVFNREPVELLEESTRTAGLRRTGNNTGEEVLGFLEFEDVFLSSNNANRQVYIEHGDSQVIYTPCSIKRNRIYFFCRKQISAYKLVQLSSFTGFC